MKLRGIVGDREIFLRDPTRSWKISRRSRDIYVDLIDIKKKLDLSDKPKVSLQAGQFVDRIIYKDLSD